jgi:protein gp37
MAETSIEWTDATWNPVAGCTVISPGCTNCYAMRMAARLEAMSVQKYKGLTRRSGGRAVWTEKIRLDQKSLDSPKGWSKPKKIFVNSMSDLFHEGVPPAFIARVWNVMAETPQHTYQILTKRPDRMVKICNELPTLSNVWLGTSVENADYLDRIDELRKVNAWVDEIESMCRAEGTAFFFKQWGGKNKKAAGRSYRGDIYDELPTLSI